ncbi:hypothetical protein ACFV0G_38010, partial [Kitasatospora sp. NPDC059571]
AGRRTPPRSGPAVAGRPVRPGQRRVRGNGARGGNGGGWFGGAGESGGGNPGNLSAAGGGGGSSHAVPAATDVLLLNEIHRPLTVSANTGGIEVSGNTVTAPVAITGSSCSDLLPDDAAVPALRANTVSGPLRREGNEPELDQADNTTGAPRYGQCR